MSATDEHDWIFDYVLQFLESDKFDASVMDFVDEKCFIFDNEEENKFEYTDIHREFKEHIEALISSNLGELGISSEMFFEACEKGRNGRDINKQVFERMVAMDDFETFKKLMVKRNMELQLEAIRSYDLAASAVKATPKSAN
jgi:The ARF-like 2 binding protein BART